jgi:uncharacterized protein YjbJ (UPF0337 family)
MGDAARQGSEGAWEGVKGWLKSATGRVTEQRDLKREGMAQGDKAEAQREAARREAEAARSRAEAEAREARQPRAQDHQ